MLYFADIGRTEEWNGKSVIWLEVFASAKEVLYLVGIIIIHSTNVETNVELSFLS